MRIAEPAVSAQNMALTPVEADLAALLADMLVLDLQRERLEREGKPTVNELTQRIHRCR